MRVALVHSFYRSDAPSGENVVVMRQAEALRNAGHDVLVVARHSDEEIKAPFYGIRSAVRVASGLGPDPTSELSDFGPDIVHVHNLFPNFGERWLSRWDGPVVATLHNFRAICANGLLYRDGAICTDCVGGNAAPALRHACYRASRAATLPLAIHNAGGLARNRLLQRADRVIVLSERSRRIFASCGGADWATRLIVIPNGIEDRATGTRAEPRHWTFVGRLSPEKGIAELVGAWPQTEALHVAGDGPLREELAALRQPGVTYLGGLAPARVHSLLRESWGLILPSRCFEGFPNVVAEAAMHGIPVLAREGSSGADFVERTGAGAVYHDESELMALLSVVRESHETLRVTSRRAFEESLGTGPWLRNLESTYSSLLAGDG